MLKLKIITMTIAIVSTFYANQTVSKYQYIDTIDKVKNLEDVATKYLSISDTTNAINTYIEIDR